MINALKRYSVALVFFFILALLMTIGTIGVKKFGEKILEDTGITMEPRGEMINK